MGGFSRGGSNPLSPISTPLVFQGLRSRDLSGHPRFTPYHPFITPHVTFIAPSSIGGRKIGFRAYDRSSEGMLCCRETQPCFTAIA